MVTTCRIVQARPKTEVTRYQQSDTDIGRNRWSDSGTDQYRPTEERSKVFLC